MITASTVETVAMKNELNVYRPNLNVSNMSTYAEKPRDFGSENGLPMIAEFVLKEDINTHAIGNVENAKMNAYTRYPRIRPLAKRAKTLSSLLAWDSIMLRPYRCYSLDRFILNTRLNSHIVMTPNTTSVAAAEFAYPWFKAEMCFTMISGMFIVSSPGPPLVVR